MSTRYDSSPKEEAKTPILTSIYNVIGALWLIGGALFVLVSVQDSKMLAACAAAGAIALFMALVCFGIAQLVMLVAKIEFNTRASDSSYQVIKLLTQISRNTTKPETHPS